ncbi:MAG: M42 family metallopeptidase [Chloroflexota bacterium]
MKSIIKTLVETPGPSGYEAQVRAVVRKMVEPFADEVKVDALGNLLVRKCGSDERKVMLAAHMDEIGIMATHVDENGFVRFTNIGGVRPFNCLGGRVRFLNGALGIIGAERMLDESKVPPLEKMYIDVGASSPKDCPVHVGDVAAFERPFLDLGDRLVAKAMDDRIGVAALIETLRCLKTPLHEVVFVFSVQEEVGLRGATTAAFGISPYVGLAVDVTRTGDTPKEAKMDVALGKGPAIKVRDRGMLSDPRVVDWMVRAAKKAGLPYQMEVLERGTTDAKAIQITQAGVPAGCLSIPCRYIHAPSEMVDFGDVQQAVKLLLELLHSPISLK